MGQVISVINLKGGVGKTQMTVALAEFMALKYAKKVLVIDLDPQTNATLSLVGEEVWLEKDQKGETLFQLFQDSLKRTFRFDLKKAIIKKVSNIGGGIEDLHLLPSSLEMIKIQDDLALMPAGLFSSVNQFTILQKAISPILGQYDLVFIDCPASLGTITMNGIYLSDYYLIPCIPDIRSTYSLPYIISRMDELKRTAHLKANPLGIVISMYRSQNKLHNSMIAQLKERSSLPRKADRWVPPLFNSLISFSVKSGEAAEFNPEVKTLKQKYGYGAAFEEYHGLAQEFLSRIK